MTTQPDGIKWVVLKSAKKIHAARVDSRVWGGATLCGLEAGVENALASRDIDERALCERCHKSLLSWGYLERDREVVANLRITYSDIARALEAQGIAATHQHIESVSLYLQNLARACARAELQDKKDWQNWLEYDEQTG